MTSSTRHRISFSCKRAVLGYQSKVADLIVTLSGLVLGNYVQSLPVFSFKSVIAFKLPKRCIYFHVKGVHTCLSSSCEKVFAFLCRGIKIEFFLQLSHQFSLVSRFQLNRNIM